MRRWGGLLSAGNSATVTVQPNEQAETLDQGTHSSEVVFTEVQSGAVRRRPIVLDVYVEPKLLVQPDSIDLTVRQGGNRIETLTITNTGDAELEFEMGTRHIGFTPVALGESDGEGPSDGNDIVGIDTVDADAKQGGNGHAGAKPVAGKGKAFAAGELLVRFRPDAQGRQLNTLKRRAVLRQWGRWQHQTAISQAGWVMQNRCAGRAHRRAGRCGVEAVGRYLVCRAQL